MGPAGGWCRHHTWTCSAASLRRAGKHLVEPALMERYFTVVFRDARYFYACVRKFNLYLLTVLEPVGAAAAPSGVTGRDTMEES